MNRLLVLFTLLSLFFFTGCGMLGTGVSDSPEETPAVSDEASAAAEDDAPSAEESEALKDEQHRQEIEAKEEITQALIAEQQQEVSEEPSVAKTVPALSVDDETIPSQETAEEGTLTETAAQKEEQASSFLGGVFGSDEKEPDADEVAAERGSSFLGGLFGLDEEEPDVAKDDEEQESSTLGGLFASDEKKPDDTAEAVKEPEPVEEPTEEESSTWSKIQGFFINEKPAEKEPDETLAMVDAEPSSESTLVFGSDLCAKAPSLIADMHERLLELQTLTDRRLRDPKNDVLFPTIYFEFDQSVIKEEGNQRLQNKTPCIIEELEKNENLVVQIEGHADERGNDEYNIALGYRRANAVSGVIKVYVTDPSKIQTISYGEEFPAVQGSSFEAWAKNRRVVFTILLKSQ